MLPRDCKLFRSYCKWGSAQPAKGRHGFSPFLLSVLLVIESARSLVAHLIGAEVLDGAGIGVASLFCPLCAVLSEHLEGTAI